MGSLFEEFKRRKVFRVAAVYAVVAWVLIQVADVVLPTFEAPAWVNQTLIFLFILGFPLALILAWAYEVKPGGIQADSGPGTTAPAAPSQWLIYATFLLVLIVAGFQIADRFLLDSSNRDRAIGSGSDLGLPAQTFRANLVLGEAPVNPMTGTRGFLAISPDGRRLAYNPIYSNTGNTGAIHDFVTGSSLTLPASDVGRNPMRPVFSPSGEQLYFVNRQPGSYSIYIVSLNSGGSRVAGFTPANPLAMTWLSEQSIIFKPHLEDVFTIGSVNGGPTETLAIPMESGDILTFPNALSGSPWIFYTVRESASSSIYDARVDAFNIESGEVRTLLDRDYNTQYSASGHIVFMRSGDLWAAPFDSTSMEIVGDQVLIERGIEHNSENGIANYSFSDSGRLVFRAGTDGMAISNERGQELSEVDGTIVPHEIPHNALQGRFSPDSSRIVFTLIDDNYNTDIAVYNIGDRTISRRTFEGQSDRPLWTKDGSQLVYRKRDIIGDSFGLWAMNADGSGQPELLMSSPLSLSPTSFSSDGQRLVFTLGIGGSSRIRMLSLGDGETPIQDLYADSDTRDAAEISPDGRWIAYGGQQRIFVSPFPDVEAGRWMVSDLTATEPHWGPDGSLYFLGADNTIYHVDVDTTEGFSTTRPEVVLNSSWTGPSEPNFNVSPDGRYILYTRENSVTTQVDTLEIVDNWFGLLERMAPPDSQ